MFDDASTLERFGYGPPPMARSRLASLGPGLLFAGTAVGVSHLVQSTRAGAEAGLGLVGLIFLAQVARYPVFRFGAHYPAATGQSLLQAYRRQGKWALVLYAIVTAGTMFTVQAAVTLVTAGLFLAVIDVRASPIGVSALILLLGGIFLAVGQYRWLSRVTRLLVVVLSVSTFAAALLVVPRVDFSTLGWGFSAVVDPAQMAFAVALMGWMPSAPDISVWQSLWVLADSKDHDDRPDLPTVTFDFHVGYFGTFFLAICFVVLGAGVLHGSPDALPTSVGGFTRGLIDLYADTLGAWSRPIIGVCALATMLTTTLAVLDAFPRAVAGLVARFRTDESEVEEVTGANTRMYWASLGLLAVGALMVISVFLTSLRVLVDVATTLSFITGPVLCGLNHRAVFGRDIPSDKRPAQWLRVLSLAAIFAQAVFAGWFVYTKVVAG